MEDLGVLPPGVEWLMIEAPDGFRVVLARDVQALAACRMETTPTVLREAGYCREAVAKVAATITDALLDGGMPAVS